jgi:hypothetical protein
MFLNLKRTAIGLGEEWIVIIRMSILEQLALRLTCKELEFDWEELVPRIIMCMYEGSSKVPIKIYKLLV